MTREEQILKAGEEITSNPFELEGFIEGAKWADEHPDLYTVTRKAIAREREYLIRKTVEFLWNCGYIETLVVDEVIDSYKKYMEEQ